MKGLLGAIPPIVAGLVIYQVAAACGSMECGSAMLIFSGIVTLVCLPGPIWALWKPKNKVDLLFGVIGVVASLALIPVCLRGIGQAVANR